MDLLMRYVKKCGHKGQNDITSPAPDECPKPVIILKMMTMQQHWPFSWARTSVQDSRKDILFFKWTKESNIWKLLFESTKNNVQVMLESTTPTML